MAHVEPMDDEMAAPRLPLPAWAMLAYVAAGAAYRLAEVATGTVRGGWRYSHDPLDSVTGAADALFVALVAAAIYGILSRRAWGPKVFVFTLLARYGMEMVARIPTYFTRERVGSPEYDLFRWVGLFHTVAIEASLAAFLVSYLYSGEVTRALGRGRAAREDDEAPTGATPLPLPAKLFALFFLLSGGVTIAWSVPMFSLYLTSGFSLSSLSPQSLLTSSELRPFMYAALGLAGVIAGIGVFWRQAWARWLVISFVGLNVLSAVGSCFSLYAMTMRSSAVDFHFDAWDLLFGIAGPAAYALLLISYVCSRPVQDAMH